MSALFIVNRPRKLLCVSKQRVVPVEQGEASTWYKIANFCVLKIRMLSKNLYLNVRGRKIKIGVEEGDFVDNHNCWRSY